MGDAVTMGSCWAWGRPPGFRPVCRSFPLAEISTGSPEENVEPLGLGSSLLRQKHWLPLPILGFLSLGYTSALRLGSLRGGVTPSQWSPKGNVRLGAGAAHRELLGDLPAGGAVDSDTVLVRLEGWRLVRPPSPPVYPLKSPHPSQACLPGTQHGLHLLPASHPNPMLLPSSSYAHCADEETETYRGKKGWKGQ